MTRARTILIALAGLLSAAGATHAQQTVYVTQEGSFDPNGGISAPYDTLHAAFAEADSRGGTRQISIGEGIYSEAYTITAPTVLFNSSDGPARIGDLGQSTRFEIATFNTHLYGEAIPESVVIPLLTVGIVGAPLHWLEGHRSASIGTHYNGSSADVIALQEVWDPDLMEGLPAQMGYQYSFKGDAIDYSELPGPIWVPGEGFVDLELNSGLVTASRHPFVSAQQVFFSTETGEDDPFEPYSSKGWLRTIIEKDGFRIAVYNLHAQAGEESTPAIRNARLHQMTQLRADVLAYRNANPSVPVIITGDFNIRGSGSPTSEYSTTLRAHFDTADLPFIDAARSDRKNRGENGVTSDANNKLNQYFGGGGSNKRLDYVLYAHSKDLSVRLVLQETETKRVRGPARTHDGLTTTELSDHWAVHTTFAVVRD